MENLKYVLEMENISKEFPGVKALDNVQLKLKPGTVHALMGENGAGKSTLMKCLFGIYEKNSGKILPTFGVDALPEALVKIEAGEMAGTVLNDAKGQASATFNMVVNLAQGKEPTEGTDLKLDNKIILIPSIGIDKSNVADFK